MPSAAKELMFKEVVDRTGEDQPVFFSGFDGLTVEQLESFRASIRKVEGKCFVAKKTLIKRHFASLGFEDIDHLLENTIMLSTVPAEPQNLSKVLVKFEKDNDEKFAVKGVFVDGQLKSKSFIVDLSKLPSREELISKLLGSMKAPVSNLVVGLNEITRQFAVVLNEIKKQKESSADKEENG